MVQSIERGVKFRLTTELDPGAKNAFDALNKRIEESQKRMHLTMTIEERAASAARGPGAAGAAAAVARRGRQEFSDPSAPTGDPAATKAEATARASRKRLSDMRRAADERDRINAEKSAEATTKFNQEMLEQQLADLRKAEAEKSKEFAAAAKRQKAEALREQQSDREFWGDFSSYGEGRGKAREAAEKKAVAEKKRLHREAEAADMKMAYAQQHLRQGFMQATTAVTGLARGMVELGLVGEKNMDKVKDGLLKVYAATDLIRGGVEMWDILARGARVYREALLAAAAAEKAVAAARAGGAIIQGVGGLGGAAGGVAAGAAGRGIAARLAGAGAAELSTGYLLGHGVKRLGGALTRIAPYAGAGAALAGIPMIAYGAHGVAQRHGTAAERYARGERGYQGQNRLGHWFQVQSEGGFIEGIARRKIHGHGIGEEGLKTQEELDAEHQKRVDASEAARARREQLDQERSSVFAKENARHDRRLQTRMEQNAIRWRPRIGQTESEQKRGEFSQLRADAAALEERRTTANAQLRDTIGPNGEVGAGREEAVRAREEVQKQIVELRKREMELARETREVDVNAGVERLRLAKDLANKAKERFESANERNRGFEERIGRMEPGQVSALVIARKKAERGETLNPDELQMLEQGDQRGQFLAKNQFERKGRESLRQFDPEGLLGNVERMKRDAGIVGAESAASRRDDLTREIERTLNVNIQTQFNTGEIKVVSTLSPEAENKLIEAYNKAVDDFNRDLPDRIEQMLKEAQKEADVDGKISRAILQQNLQSGMFA